MLNSLTPEPNIVVHTGDVTDNGILADYELAVEKIREIKFEMIVAPGNHDERNYGGSLFKELIGPVDFETSVGRAVFLVLDSAVPDIDNGRLGRRRHELIQSKLSRLPESAVKVVVFHHHLIPVPFAGREADILEDAGDALRLLLGMNVNLVLMGHRHVRHSIKVNNTVLTNAGTVSSARTRGRLGHSFNVVDIMEDLSIKVTEIDILTGEQRPLGDFRYSA